MTAKVAIIYARSSKEFDELCAEWEEENPGWVVERDWEEYDAYEPYRREYRRIE